MLERARDLLEHHPLRAYDAVQLAAGLIANDALLAAGLPSLTFLAADTRLLNAATVEGLGTDDPNAVAYSSRRILAAHARTRSAAPSGLPGI